MAAASDPVAHGLPHREPFIFIDEVRELHPGESARCEKTFGDDEPFFRGHFPGNPLVPGVILAEAMAQTAGIAAGSPGAVYLLSAIRQMKFIEPVGPGGCIEFAAVKTGEMGSLLQFRCEARADGRLVAEGQIVLAGQEP